MVTAKTLITKSCLELEVCITKLLNKIKSKLLIPNALLQP